MKFVIETEAGRLWGPFKTAARAAKWAHKKLARGPNNVVNAFKIRPLHRPR